MNYFTRHKRVNKQTICLCTSSEENLRFIGAIVGGMVGSLFPKEDDEEEEHGQSVKIMFTCISYLV